MEFNLNWLKNGSSVKNNEGPVTSIFEVCIIYNKQKTVSSSRKSQEHIAPDGIIVLICSWVAFTLTTLCNGFYLQMVNGFLEQHHAGRARPQLQLGAATWRKAVTGVPPRARRCSCGKVDNSYDRGWAVFCREWNFRDWAPCKEVFQ